MLTELLRERSEQTLSDGFREIRISDQNRSKWRFWPNDWRQKNEGRTLQNGRIFDQFWRTLAHFWQKDLGPFCQKLDKSPQKWVENPTILERLDPTWASGHFGQMSHFGEN